MYENISMKPNMNRKRESKEEEKTGGERGINTDKCDISQLETKREKRVRQRERDRANDRRKGREKERERKREREGEEGVREREYGHLDPLKLARCRYTFMYVYPMRADESMQD